MTAKKSAASNAPARQQRDYTPATADQVATVKAVLARHTKVVANLLERTNISPTEFVTWVANACRQSKNGELWKCDPETVVGAALRCAQLNLAPNDGQNLAWIIPYAGKAQFQIGYGGVLELARRAVPGLRFDGRPVYPGDSFSLDYGRQPPLKHVPSFARRPPRERGGPAVLWYVRAIFPDGREQVHALDREGVEYHRSFSKVTAADSMWNTAYDAAALKSVVLDMRRWLPHTQPLARAVAADGAVIDVRTMNEEHPELPTATEQIGAGQVDDSETADAEIVTDPADAADQAWIEQAKTTNAEEAPKP